MRKPIISDQVWTQEGGTPWTVIAIQGSSAVLAKATEPDRIEPLHSLKLVGLPDEKIPPTMPLYPPTEQLYLAFLQAHPDRVAELDLHPVHADALREKLGSSPKLPAPVQQIETGASVTVKDGSFEGEHGTVLCFNPRSQSYTVRCSKASYLLVVSEASVCQNIPATAIAP